MTPQRVVGLALNHSQRLERIEFRSGLVPSVGEMFPEMCSAGDKSDNLASFGFLKEKLGPVWGQEISGSGNFLGVRKFAVAIFVWANPFFSRG